jgi:hypothetical protein
MLVCDPFQDKGLRIVRGILEQAPTFFSTGMNLHNALRLEGMWGSAVKPPRFSRRRCSYR